MTKGKVIPSGWWVNQASSSNRGHVRVKPHSSYCMENYCNSLTSPAPLAGQCQGRNQIFAGHCVIPANVPGCTPGQVLACNSAG
jgi:hypothetical protein